MPDCQIVRSSTVQRFHNGKESETTIQSCQVVRGRSADNWDLRQARANNQDTKIRFPDKFSILTFSMRQHSDVLAQTQKRTESSFREVGMSDQFHEKKSAMVCGRFVLLWTMGIYSNARQ